MRGIWISFLLIVVIVGCSNTDEEISTVDNPSQPYPQEEAFENGDVVVGLEGETKNFDRFEVFLESVDRGRSDEIRITTYTIEGDPIFYNLQYNGEQIVYTYDNTEDGYGSGKGKRSTNCSQLNKLDTEDGVEYRLSGCENNELAGTFYLSP